MVAPIRARETTTIRVSADSRNRLQEMAAEQGRSVAQVVDLLLEKERRRRFWESFDVALDRLRADPKAWADYHAEADEWESATVGDGSDEYAGETWE